MTGLEARTKRSHAIKADPTKIRNKIRRIVVLGEWAPAFSNRTSRSVSQGTRMQETSYAVSAVASNFVMLMVKRPTNEKQGRGLVGVREDRTPGPIRSECRVK